MKIEEVISELQRQFPEYQRGGTAMPDGPSGYYDQAKNLDFEAEPNSDTNFCATGPKGGKHYIGVDHTKKKITCGPKRGSPGAR